MRVSIPDRVCKHCGGTEWNVYKIREGRNVPDYSCVNAWNEKSEASKTRKREAQKTYMKEYFKTYIPSEETLRKRSKNQTERMRLQFQKLEGRGFRKYVSKKLKIPLKELTEHHVETYREYLKTNRIWLKLQRANKGLNT